MRPDLPSGTVTFLLTDVEGSTRLLHDLGAEGYAQALAEHRTVIRAACARESGVEVDTQGDAFFFAFPTAPGAVAAAAAFTDALSFGPIRVRVGLHTGTPLLTDEGYVGDDVHLAARIAAAGHGGQVLVASSTASFLKPRNTVLQGLELTDLGEHRLKDIAEAVPLYQLGAGSFPPLKTISNTNLPRPASSFLGRQAELQELLSRIEQGARLVTLTGPGGTGKTRLALEAATTLVSEYKAGVFWVGLASLRDPALVTETISQVLGAKDGLAAHIGARELLLLLDNLEQVIEAAPVLSELVQACPNLTLLVTSRELLRLQGEVEYPVPPLASSEAVALFCARAQLPASEEIADLCARLDNLPLAVELAAARAKALTVAQILERLSQRLDLLQGGRDADPRQQTLRATIAWSYDLLTPAEQELFQSLSVFAGGCTLEAAEEVADASLDTLQSLVEKSLLRFTPSDTGGRYWMLETIREYASGRLRQIGESDKVRERLAAHLLGRAERAEPELQGIEASDWLDRLDAERENFRAALDWAEEAGTAELELRLATALRDFWDARGPIGEALRRLEHAVHRAGDLLPQRRADALREAALMALRIGDLATAERLASELLVLARTLGDSGSEVSALIKLAHASAGLGDRERAHALLREGVAVARESANSEALARAFINQSHLAASEGDFQWAAELAEESLREGGDLLEARVKAIALINLASARIRQCDGSGAAESARAALELAWGHGQTSLVAGCLETLAEIEAARDPLRAGQLLGAADVLMEEIGERLDADTVAAVRAGTDPQTYERVFAEGRALPLHEAVAYALASIH